MHFGNDINEESDGENYGVKKRCSACGIERLTNCFFWIRSFLKIALKVVKELVSVKQRHLNRDWSGGIEQVDLPLQIITS